MNFQFELSKLQSILQIPIDNLIFHENYVGIYFSNTLIGNIPYFNVSGIINYDTEIGILNNLNWYYLYNNSKVDIDTKAIEISTNKIESITLGTFKRIYLRYHNGTIDSAVCSYISGMWDIRIETT